MSACIEWTKSHDTGGYGHLRIGGKMCRAHRVAWENAKGPIPEGLHVLHTCDNRGCVNPEHLYVGTHTDNMQDRLKRGKHNNASKTHCMRGHKFNEANTYTYRRKDGGVDRLCRVCRHALVTKQRRQNKRLQTGT